VHGSSNNETTIPMKKAQTGFVIHDTNLFIVGFQDLGTQKANHHLPYQKKSFRFKSQIVTQRVQTTIFKAIAFSIFDNAWYKPIHIAK